MVKFYLNNYLAGQESEDCIGKLDSEVAAIKAQYSINKDIETNTLFIPVPDNIVLSQISNLPVNWNYVLAKG